jgi:hypothetical protein
MIVKTMTMEEFSNYLEEEHDEDEFNEETVIETDEFGDNDLIMLFGPAVRLSELGLIIASGVFLQYCEDTGLNEPDWDICLIYEDVPDDEFDPTKFVYFEQGVETSAISNYMHYRSN